MNNNVCIRLKEFRNTYGFTQAQVADYLMISQPYFSKLENGKISLKLSYLNKLCVLYNCSPEYILEGKMMFLI